MTTTLAQSLADDLEKLNQELRDFLNNCPDDQWRNLMPDENWPVNVSMNHIMTGHFAVVGIIKRKLRGQSMPTLTNEFVENANQANADNAKEVSRADVLALLDKYGASSADYIRTLSDDDLSQTIYFGPANRDLEIGQIIKLSLLRSARDHLANAVRAVNSEQ